MINFNKTVFKGNLEDECEVTEVSLKRALWYKQNGFEVDRITVRGSDTADVEVQVIFWHEDKPSDVFTFTGFSVGYGGTAPVGFKRFLELFEIKWDGFDPIKNSIKNGPYSWSD
jgi:hypothetical protein